MCNRSQQKPDVVKRCGTLKLRIHVTGLIMPMSPAMHITYSKKHHEEDMSTILDTSFQGQGSVTSVLCYCVVAAKWLKRIRKNTEKGSFSDFLVCYLKNFPFLPKMMSTILLQCYHTETVFATHFKRTFEKQKYMNLSMHMHTRERACTHTFTHTHAPPHTRTHTRLQRFSHYILDLRFPGNNYQGGLCCLYIILYSWQKVIYVYLSYGSI